MMKKYNINVTILVAFIFVLSCNSGNKEKQGRTKSLPYSNEATFTPIWAKPNPKENSSVYERSHSSETIPSIKRPDTVLVLHPNKGLVYFNDEPFNGVSESFYENGVLSEQVSYLEGKKHGPSKKWFANGTASFEANYIHGKRNGEARSWWRDGTTRSLSNYINGTAHGLQRQWYRSGALFKEISLSDGKEEGLQKAWRENGKIYNNYEAKNGRIFGLKRANLCFEIEDEKVQFN